MDSRDDPSVQAERAFRRQARRLLAAGALLIALLLASLGSAWLNLGWGNLAAGLGIAALKAVLIVALFMRLGRGPALLRLVAVVALFAWAVLGGLYALEDATRPTTPAPWQSPQQLPPLFADRTGAPR